MADSWIKFRKKLIKDGRVLATARACNASRVAILGGIVTMWCLGDEYCDSDGLLTGYTKAELETEIGLPGFLDALPSDWFEMIGDTPQLPMYQQHNGETAKQRACNATRVTSFRNRVTQEALPEKRREEKTRTTTTTPLPPPATNGQGGGGGGGGDFQVDWQKAKAEANRICQSMEVPAPKAGKYRRLILQVAGLADRPDLGRQWLDDALEDTRIAKPTRPWQYWAACLRTGAENRGVKLESLLVDVKVPEEFCKAAKAKEGNRE